MTDRECLFVGGPLDGERRAITSSVFTIRTAKPVPIFSAAPLELLVEPETLNYRLVVAPTGEHVMLADGACWTEAVDTERWPRRVDPDRAVWRRLGPWLWRGDGIMPDPKRPKAFAWRLRETVTYLLADVSTPTFRTTTSTIPKHLVDPRELALEALAGRQTTEDYVCAELRWEMEYELRPLCPVPDCDKKIAESPLVADRMVRPLHVPPEVAAGWLKPDEELRLCPEHMSEELRRSDWMHGPPWKLFTVKASK